MNYEELRQRLDRMEGMLATLIREKANPETKDVITIEEAAPICGLSVKTLYNYMSNGKLNIRVTKTGRTLTMNRADLIEWKACREYTILKGS